MCPMSNPNSLPSGEGHTPAEPAAAAAPVAVISPRTGRRPLWARLLGRLLAPWLALKIETPEHAQDPDGRPVVYVLEDYGLSNALILDKACQDAGLPSALIPLPGDLLGRKRGYLALSRRSSANPFNPLLAEKKAKRTHSDSLSKLLQAHQRDGSLDVRLVPVSGTALERSSLAPRGVVSLPVA